MYKVIFSDLDGTLLNDDKKISQTNIDAINKAKQKGVKFVFCTGRLPFCYQMFKDEIDLGNAVSTNGEIVFSDGKIIRANHPSREDAKKVIEYGIKNDEYERIFTFDKLYLLNVHKGGKDVHFYEGSMPVSNDEALKVVDSNDVYKLGFYAKHDHILEIQKDIEDMNLNVDMTSPNPEFLEVILKGEAKGKGIIEYCKCNGIDIEETIGVGDEENDRAMLETVGLACSPSNASKSIKKICDYTTKANNNEGAIAEIIEKYII